ncbi:hypothetical protein COR50_04375 [Chitinophaga caeni]|uniref:Uncharacterized protein n=1 Tax=Chitinophaga caeni TaxID=2029983 RepID=A0A291QRG2_9BACT|nr:hypothetical protein [Chitinophaga caeni]ATL46472.1 hypothetical protein COR50_04375 [Chitinophaga caeni]
MPLCKIFLGFGFLILTVTGANAQHYASTFVGDTIVSKSYMRNLKHQVYLLKATNFNCQLEQMLQIYTAKLDTVYNASENSLVVTFFARNGVKLRIQTFQLEQGSKSRKRLEDQYFNIKGELVYTEEWKKKSTLSKELDQLVSRQRITLDERGRQQMLVFERWDEKGHWASRMVQRYAKDGQPLNPYLQSIDPDEFWD